MNEVQGSGNKFFKHVEKATNSLMDRREELGIFSLSKVNDNELLWAHYGDSHKGFCIGYELEGLVNVGKRSDRFYFNVEYSPIPPEIGIGDLDFHSSNLIKKMTGVKSKEWSYEKEIRIVTNTAGEQLFEYTALKEIIFGLRMDDSSKDEIMRRLQGRNINYYQIELMANSYQLLPVQCEDKYKNASDYMSHFTLNSSKELKFKIIEKKLDFAIKKGEIKIEIKDKINEDEILQLATYLKKSHFFEMNRIYMFFYLESLKTRNLAWAFSNYINDSWHINIHPDECFEFKYQ